MKNKLIISKATKVYINYQLFFLNGFQCFIFLSLQVLFSAWELKYRYSDFSELIS